MEMKKSLMVLISLKISWRKLKIINFFPTIRQSVIVAIMLANCSTLSQVYTVFHRAYDPGKVDKLCVSWNRIFLGVQAGRIVKDFSGWFLGAQRQSSRFCLYEYRLVSLLAYKKDSSFVLARNIHQRVFQDSASLAS